MENIEQQIIACAHQLFVEKGYVNTSMSDIAAAVGITRPAMHYYFRTKERLFQVIFGDIVQEVIPRIHGILASDTPFMERLDRIVGEYLAMFLKNPDLPYFLLSEIQRDTGHLIQVARELKIDGYIADIRKTVEREIETGRMRNVPLRVIFLTLYSLMVTPFLMKNLTTTLMFESEERFADFMQEWKRNILSQMGHLLCPDDGSGNAPERKD